MGAPITVLAYRHWTVCDEDQGAAGFGELRWYRAKSPLEKSKGDFFLCERESARLEIGVYAALCVLLGL